MVLPSNASRFFKKSLIASSLLITATQVNAAGFQLNAQSATGIGRAFAGDAVIADNASVMARNAAAMALFDRNALSLGANILMTDINVSDATYTAGGNDFSSNYDDAGGVSLAPNIHAIFPINEQFAVGVNLYSNFGTVTDFGSDFTGTEYGGLTDLALLNLGLAASYRINAQWSVGAGLDIVYGLGELERKTSSHPYVFADTTLVDVDVDGVGLGFNLGTVFELNANNRFGLSYHYSPEMEATGDVTYLGQSYKNFYLPLPDMAEFSGYHRLTGTKYAVHYSVQWIGWSAFDTLQVGNSSSNRTDLGNYQWKNAMHFALGGTYYLNDNWTLRAGYMYDQSAQDEVTSISVPDSDRQWFSAGFTYHLSERNNVDFGFTYLMGDDVQVDETLGFSSIEGVTRADAVLIAMQYSHEF